MSVPYYHLLGQIFVTHHAVRNNSELFGLMSETSFSRRRLEKEEDIHPLVERGANLVEERIEQIGEDRSAEHQMHTSAEEVEMWWQTAKFRLEKAVDEDESLLSKAASPGFHFGDHGVVVVAKALRMISMIRAEPRIREQMGESQSVKDLLLRGWTLLRKFYANSDLVVEAGPSVDPSHEIFEELAEHRSKMVDWVRNFEQAIQQLEGHEAELAELSYVPAGVGIPLGGTGYSITLHENAQRDAPDPKDRRPAPGWSAGRQGGRNNENLGGGWVPPK
jgi:hypothetical protein